MKTANPFISLMSLRLTLKLWIKYRKEHLKRAEEHEAKGELNYNSSDDDDKIAVRKIKKNIKTIYQDPEIKNAQVAPSDWVTPKASRLKRSSTTRIKKT